MNSGQTELAKRAGYRPSTVSDLEADRHVPRESTLAALAGALGVRTEALLDDVECVREILRLMGSTAVIANEDGTPPSLYEKLERRIRELIDERVSALGIPTPGSALGSSGGPGSALGHRAPPPFGPGPEPPSRSSPSPTGPVRDEGSGTKPGER